MQYTRGLQSASGAICLYLGVFDEWVDSDSTYIPCNKERVRIVEIKNSILPDDLITNDVSVLNNSSFPSDDLFTEEDVVCCIIYI